MQQNHVNVELAIEQLRAEGSSRQMQESARMNLQTRRRVSTSKLLAIATTIVVAFGIFWPHGKSGVAWAQVLKDSVNAPCVHSVSRYKNGRIADERWTKGNKEAWTLYDVEGRLLNEWRTNDDLAFNYFSFEPRAKKLDNPNRRRFGEIYRRKPGQPSAVQQIGGNLENLLRGFQYQLVRQSSSTRGDEAVTEFEVHVTKPDSYNFVAVVDDKTKLITEIREAGGRWVRKIDYPASIPDEVFAPIPRVAKGAEIYDIRSQKEQIKQTVNAGLGTSNGVTLRLVALDYTGGLWVIWSGPPVDGRMTKPYRSPGLSLGAPYGLRKLTSSADGKKDVPAYAADGSRLFGMGRTAKTKVGKTVDISIPTQNGEAVFKQVPVLRVGMIYSYAPWHNESLGVSAFQ